MLEGSHNPMCEVFPKGNYNNSMKRVRRVRVFVVVAVCNYQRYGRGGGQETKGAICILSLNMINDKVSPSPHCLPHSQALLQVFAILWVWHCVLILAGINRIVTRSIQLMSNRVRYFLMKMMMHR